MACGLLACGDPAATSQPNDAGDREIGQEEVGDVLSDTDRDRSSEDAVPDATPTDVSDAGSEPQVDTSVDFPIVQDADVIDLPDEEAMVIVAVSPELGPEGGGTEIILIGLGFTFDTDVFLGGRLCENIDVVDETKIICDTPANPAGSYDVKVINQMDIDSLDDGFRYFAPLEVAAIEPDRGPSQGGMPVVVHGAGFSQGVQVSVGGRIGLAIEVVDSQALRLLTPPGLAGLRAVQVSGENGLSVIEEGFEYYDPVRIERVLPGAGPAAGGSVVTLQGRGFTQADDMFVRFGLLQAELEVTDSQELSVTTPPGPPDTAVDITVGDAFNGSVTLPSGYYYYSGSPGFGFFSLSPGQGSSEGGDEVVLSGTQMDSATSVTFDGVSADILVTDVEYLIVRAPAHAPASVDVEVFNDTTSSRLDGVYTYLEGVEFSAIVPEAGSVEGGDPITVTGSGFSAGATLRIRAFGGQRRGGCGRRHHHRADPTRSCRAGRCSGANPWGFRSSQRRRIHLHR